MRALRRNVGPQVEFVLDDVDAAHRGAVVELGFRAADGEYVRSFQDDARHLEQAWENFRLKAEEMVLQTAGVHRVPWERALRSLLRRLDGEGIDWWLAGSGALAVRGVDVAPRDLDLITDARGASRLADLFADVLVEPLTPVSGWFCEWWCRAFSGARVEWVGDVGPSADAPDPSDFGPHAAAELEIVRWEGFEVRVPGLELQLAVAERRGLFERVARIREELG